ncbi:MATE family efflux transporter [Flavonifractor plautii]|nr:MATE family efflux transporter [Flavonifractor plautii]QIA29270.1 MATE family efflux transporter [Flavonifractor plautii]
MQMDLTRGGITRPMLLFAGPMIAGNLLQQCYNIADTLIVGRALGASALASVGFSFTLMTFLTSVLLGVCFTFLYNYFACLLRSVGNSVAPMAFLAVSTVLNIGLDLWFVLGLGWGVAGAAGATVLAQGVSAAGIALYGWRRVPLLRLERRHCKVSRGELGRIMNYSLLTCVQQSVMNFGILMVQGLVNSFGVNVMAAFAAAVKIDAFAYLPVQDFGNAFSTFVAQNTGAQKTERIRRGIRSAVGVSIGFCLVSSLLVCLFAAPLMGLFVEPGETEIIAVGVEYLRIEGMCYCGIGILFLLYGLFRGLGRPGVSVVLTVVSLGTRVALAYLLAPIPAVGLKGIWWAVPIGWVLADLAGLVLWRRGESGGEAGPHAKCQSAERL